MDTSKNKHRSQHHDFWILSIRSVWTKVEKWWVFASVIMQSHCVKRVFDCLSALPSLVSALCNFSERVESQPYIHVYFKIQGLNTWHCLSVVSTYIISDKLLQTSDLHLGQRSCTLTNGGGRSQISHNANFYNLLLQLVPAAQLWGFAKFIFLYKKGKLNIFGVCADIRFMVLTHFKPRLSPNICYLLNV